MLKEDRVPKLTDKQVSLKDLINIFFSKIHLILLFFFVFLGGSIYYAYAINTPQYIAKANFVISKAINNSLLITASELINSQDVRQATIERINEDPNYLNLNFPIDESILKSGSQAFYTASSPFIYVSFTSENKEISKIVVNHLLDSIVEYGNENFSVFNGSLLVGQYASDSVSTTTSKTITILTGSLLGLVLGCVISLVPVYVSGKVIFSSDYDDLGVPVVENFQYSDYIPFNRKSHYTDLNTKIELHYSNHRFSTFGIITPSPVKKSYDYALDLIRKHSLDGVKVFVFDLDWTKGGNIHTIPQSNQNEIDCNQIKELTPYLHLMDFSKCRLFSSFYKSLIFINFYKEISQKYEKVFFIFPPSKLDDVYVHFSNIIELNIVNVFLYRTTLTELKKLNIVSASKTKSIYNIIK